MALEDILAASVVRPVLVGWLDFLADPVRGWTGPGAFAPTGTGDTDLDGNTFTHAGGAITISPFHQDQGIGSPVTVTMAAGDMDDEEVFQQLVVDQRTWLGGTAKFWEFFLLADETGVSPDFQVLFTGAMTNAKIVRTAGEPALISITCDVDTQRAFMAPTRYVDHQALNSGDTFSTFIPALMRGPITLGAQQTAANAIRQMLAGVPRHRRGY